MFLRNGRIKQKISMPDHIVSLFRNNIMVGRFTFPPTDSRFVKKDDLFKIAFNHIKTRQSQYNGFDDSNEPCLKLWDRFEVSYYGLIMKGNRKGELIVDKSLD
jgi:hypothetical protein